VKIGRKVALSVAVTVIAWASAFAGIRAAVLELSPGHVALFRFAVASVLLGALAATIRPVRRIEARDCARTAFAGLLGYAIYHLALNAGEVTVGAAAASLLVSLVPMITTALSVLFLGERPRMALWLGLGVGIAGASLVALGEHAALTFNSGASLVLIAAVAQAAYFVVQKPLLAKYDAFTVTAWTMWSGTLALLLAFGPSAAPALRHASLGAWMAVLYLGVVPSAVAMFTWTYALSQLPASSASVFLLLVPAVSIPIAWIWLRELPSVVSMVGGLITIAGVALARRKR